MDTNLVIIAAMAKNRVIGRAGEIPWHLRNDLKHFAEVTKGKLVVVGRKTYENIIKRLGKPLSNRKMMVLTRQPDFKAENGVLVAHSWEEVLTAATAEYPEVVFIAGGAEVYKLALPKAKAMFLTMVNADCKGDAFFPDYDIREWREVEPMLVHLSADAENDYPFKIVYLERQPLPSLVNLDNARLEEQRQTMEEIMTEGNCPFCMDQVLKWHKEPMLRSGNYWLLTTNQWPYEEAATHLLLIAKVHAERLAELPPAAGEELIGMVQWAEQKFGSQGGGLAMRFGDTALNGATVAHLHVHFLLPRHPESPGFQPIRFRIGGRPKK